MLATLGQPTACINAFIGLGYLFTSDTGKARAVRMLVGPLLRFLINRKNSVALVQNRDDMAALIVAWHCKDPNCAHPRLGR